MENDTAIDMIPTAHPLTVHHDVRGRLAVLCPEGAPHVYFTTLYPNIVKAYHSHLVQFDRMTCVKGMVRIVCWQEGQEVFQFISGERAPVRVDIPPGWWHGLQALGSEEALVVNCPTIAYDAKNPDEQRRPWDDPAIPFDWLKRNG